MQRSYSARPGSTRPPSARPPSTRPASSMGGRSTVAPEDRGQWIVTCFLGQDKGLLVGLAAYDVESGKFSLTQLCDTLSFPRTRHFLHLHPPVEVVVPESYIVTADQSAYTGPGRFGGGTQPRWSQEKRVDPTGKLLVEMVETEIEVDPYGMKKTAFDANNGWEALTSIIVENASKQGVLLSAQPRDCALSAFGAMISYLRSAKQISFAPGSQRIAWQVAEGTLLIDAETAQDLELVSNLLNPGSTLHLKGLLDRTHTKMGKRLLSATLLQPCVVPEIVDNRLDAVQELLQNEDIHRPLKNSLKAFKEVDFERLAQQLTQRSTRDDPDMIERRIGTLIQVRTALLDLKLISAALTKSTSVLLRTAAEALDHPKADLIAETIGACFNDDVSGHDATKGQGKKLVKIYAVRAEYNQLLDIARLTHKENVEDIMNYRDQLNVDHQLRLDVSLEDRGFKFIAQSADMVGIELPSVFTNVNRNGNRWTFTTRDLIKLNARMKESEEELFRMCAEVTAELLDTIVSDIGCLYDLAEAIARLDMLSSFAEISNADGFVRPEFTNTLAIKEGRHPVASRRMPAGTFVPNDTYADSSSTFHLVQGANMAGKTTYMKQIGVLTVMAFSGCFVPATYACFRPVDALLTRLSNNDSIERSLSTFAVEMSSMSMILSLATQDSLVLVDELGRGTAPMEGMAIAQAIAEALVQRKTICFFATHFKELAETLSPFPTAGVLHLRTTVSGRAQVMISISSQGQRNGPADEHGIKTSYTYKVVRGACQQEHYGLELAKLAALPPDVLEKAREVAEKLSGIAADGRAQNIDEQSARKQKDVMELRKHLMALMDEELDSTELRERLIDLQLKYETKLKGAGMSFA